MAAASAGPGGSDPDGDAPQAGADTAVVAEVRRLARGLLPASDEVAARVTEHVLQQVPELARPGEPGSVAVVTASSEQNIGSMLAMLAFDITPRSVEPPEGTRELLAALIAAGGDVTDLLRAYRVGHELLWREWAEHVRHHARSDVDVVGVLQVSSRHLFDVVDGLCTRVVELHARSVRPGGEARRTVGRVDLVRTLLGPDPVDPATSATVLGYDLSRHHVGLLASPLAAGADVRREIERVVGAARVPALVVPSGRGEWWAWLGWIEPPAPDELARLAAVAVAGVIVGLGEPDQGRDGFRRTHAAAAEADRTRRLAVRPAPGVVRHRDVEITALLCRDPDRARRLAAERLGPLAAADETGARLRATLRALLDHGHHRGLAAQALGVHQKTVAYRLEQAEGLLRRSLSEHTFDLDAALMIHAALGDGAT